MAKISNSLGEKIRRVVSAHDNPDRFSDEELADAAAGYAKAGPEEARRFLVIYNYERALRDGPRTKLTLAEILERAGTPRRRSVVMALAQGARTSNEVAWKIYPDHPAWENDDEDGKPGRGLAGKAGEMLHKLRKIGLVTYRNVPDPGEDVWELVL